ncbi:stalk domain-containing protein [Cohnella suwonensis]|uniref:Stalk domain-containing protein n=1 Tax=Cohnella suwonensis TaxID=696072 RepID=A0ABW0LXW3_9BACL
MTRIGNGIGIGKKGLALLLALVMLIAAAIPAEAAAAGTKEIRVKVGSAQMKINGEAIKIQAPFLSANNVMVPLSVFTNAKGFGAKLQMTNNKVIKLTYLKHVVTMTTGSKAATIDGKKSTLAVAPANKNSVLMVPLVPVAKAFGAAQKNDAATKEIVLSFKSATAPAGGTGSAGNAGSGSSISIIDSDFGKSKIGDSYYGWSMSYPTGLLKADQSSDGDMIIFQDVKKEYELGVFVEEAKNELTTNEKRTSIYDHFTKTEKAVDIRTVSGAAGSYEKIVSKNNEGYFFESRAIQANGFLYVIYFGKLATSASELDRYSKVLDSFKTSFDRSDVSLKDFTQIIDGYKTFSDADYGMDVKLPKEWSIDDKSAYPSFYTDGAYVFVDISSKNAGDTADAWLKRKLSRFEQTFAPEYRKVLEQKDVVWNGVPAKALKISYSADTETWWEEYEVFAIQGEYRYYTEISYLDSQKTTYASLFDTVLRTLTVNTATVEKNFGLILDDVDDADRTSTVTKKSEKYGYGVTFQQYWTGVSKNFEEESVEYSFGGGGFGVDAWTEPESSFAEVAGFIDQHYQDLLSKNAKMTIVENTMTTLGGLQAKKVVIDDKTNDDKNTPNRMITYYVYNNGQVYTVWGLYYLANGSDFIKKNLESALNSFVVTVR